MQQYDTTGNGALTREDMGTFIKETLYNDGFVTQRIPDALLQRKLDKVFGEFDIRGKGCINLREFFRFM